MNGDRTIDESLRQLRHDAKTHLFVVSMGLKVLEASRHNADHFADTLESIRRDGIEPLQQNVRRLIELGQEFEASPD
jgi:hypothetical protein